MDVFDLRHRVIDQYSDYVGSFVTMRDQRIREHVEGELRSGALWETFVLSKHEKGMTTFVAMESGHKVQLKNGAHERLAGILMDASDAAARAKGQEPS